MHAVMKSLFEQGKPRYGRFARAPASIDIKHFKYSTPFRKLVTGYKKQLSYKQFQFMSFNNDRYMIGLAIVDLGWVGHGFFYCYDLNTNKVFELSYLQPFAKDTHVCSHQIGTSYFKKGKFSIQIKKLMNSRHIVVQRGDHILLDAMVDQTSVQPLAVCTPTGVSGWTFTHKQTTLAVKGRVYFNDQMVDLAEQGFMAAVDDTCGMLRTETAWHWLSLSGINNHGERFGLNLATGVNETFSTENSLWQNGQIDELPAVLFEQQDERHWRIFSANGDVDLQVTTTWRRHEAKNFIVVASQFSQWVSMVSGTIKLNNQCIDIAPQVALLEQHYAKW